MQVTNSASRSPAMWRSRRECRRLVRRQGFSFYLGMLALPQSARQAAQAIGGFFRLVDEITDSADPAEQRLTRLNDLLTDLDDALSGRGAQALITPALVDTIHRYDLDMALLRRYIAAESRDIVWRPFQTYSELESHMADTAGVMGPLAFSILGGANTNTISKASQFGIALQFIDHVRDARGDIVHDRLHIPLADLRMYGVDPTAPLADSAAFAELERFEIQRAFYLLRSALDLIWLLAPTRPILARALRLVLNLQALTLGYRRGSSVLAALQAFAVLTKATVQALLRPRSPVLFVNQPPRH